MKHMIFLLGTGLWICSTALAGASQSETYNIDFQKGGEISLTNTNGVIQITSWDKDQVEVEATKSFNGWARNADRKMDKVEIEINERPGNLTINTYHPNKVNMWGSVTVSYKLKVPRQVSLRVRNANGGVFINGIEGVVEAKTTNGKLVLEDIHGSFNAKTTNGKIQAELVEHHGRDITCKTTNGSIRLKLPQTIQANLKAGVTNGSVNTNIPISVEGKIKRTKVRGAINGGGVMVDLNTTNGSITIDEA